MPIRSYVATIECNPFLKFDGLSQAPRSSSVKHAVAHIDSSDSIASLSHQAGVQSCSATEFQNRCSACHVVLNQAHDVVDLRRIVLVAVEQVVVARVSAECTHLTSASTAWMTVRIWALSRARPL